MNGQVRKLRKEPEVLEEYVSVVKEQLDSGVIKRAMVLERSGKVYYISHMRRSKYCKAMNCE